MNKYNEIFEYRNGFLFWKIRRRGLNHKRYVGTYNKGYLWVRSDLLDKVTSVHVVIWLMHGNCIPEGMVVDHINRDTLDNRIENLRIAARAENSWNASGKKSKKTRLPKNVYVDWTYKGKKAYRAQVCVRGKIFRIGGFQTPEQASIAAHELRQKHHGCFASG